MPGRRSETIRNKNRRKKTKKFFLASKERWLIEERLVPLYQHLVDGYSEKMRDEWKVKVKEEPQDNDLLESHQDQQSSSNNNNQQVTYRVFPLSYFRRFNLMHYSHQWIQLIFGSLYMHALSSATIQT